MSAGSLVFFFVIALGAVLALIGLVSTFLAPRIGRSEKALADLFKEYDQVETLRKRRGGDKR